jgi:large subunit ribosomal protein L24
MAASRIRKDDTVICIAGSERGKTGKVLEIDRRRERALVEGLNIVKKTLKRTNETPQGGIVEVEAAMALSNLMPFDPEAKKGVRIRSERKDGRPVRASAASGSAHKF